MTRIDTKARLLSLEETNLKLSDAEDVRGRRVLDREGKALGKVEDLVVDESERRVRFLRIESGGFLGMGGTEVLVPVEAIQSIAGDEVRIDQTRERVAGAPRYDPKLGDDGYWTRSYGYYGYPPFWTAGYVYPPYPNYRINM